MLPSQAALTHLINVINMWQATHHVPAGKLLECLEADMPEALMPAPRRVHAPSSKAHRVRDVESDRVEPVGGATHSSKEASAFVTDPHDPLIDMDVVPILVQLPDADEVDVEAWD